MTIFPLLRLLLTIPFIYFQYTSFYNLKIGANCKLFPRNFLTVSEHTIKKEGKNWIIFLSLGAFIIVVKNESRILFT